MLNNRDLQQIRKVVRAEVKEEVSTQLKPVNSSLKTLETDMKFVKKRLKKVEQYSKDTADFLDRQNIDLEKRTKRIENHLSLPPIQ